MIHPLTKAFKELLLDHDYFARRRIADCRSCASVQIPDEYQNYFAYTTDQSDDDIKESGEGYIYWSAPEDNPKTIIKVLKKHGLKVKWNKKPSTAIFIKVIKE